MTQWVINMVDSGGKDSGWDWRDFQGDAQPAHMGSQSQAPGKEGGEPTTGQKILHGLMNLGPAMMGKWQ